MPALQPNPSRPPKRPIVHRFLIVCVLLLAAHAARAQTPAAQGLTEREVVERVLLRPAFRQLTRALVDAQQGKARAAGAYPNPQLIYTREQTYNASGTGEDYLSVAQAIDLGGRRRLERKSGALRAQAAAEEAKLTLLGAAADARARFYECVYRAARARALEEWLAQITRALEVVKKREARGDAAQYDKLRLEREHAVAAARMGVEQAYYETARAKLAGLLELDPEQLVPSGTLLPESLTERHDVSSSPGLRALDVRSQAATVSAHAAGRGAIPDLRLEAGYKGVGMNSGGRTSGFLLGASLALPLWDRGTGLRAAARAEARQHDAEKLLLRVELSSEVDALHSQTEHIRAVAVRFREDSSRASSALVRTATAGYEGGELGLFELLDAYRGAAEDQLTALDMELSARQAAIELDRLTGTGLP
jgi:cobalt-zinc-cadmium efflux system outer membrane protein